MFSVQDAQRPRTPSTRSRIPSGRTPNVRSCTLGSSRMPHVATGDSTFTLTRSSLLASYSDHTTQQTKVPLCRPPSMSQVMVRMVHAAVKFPQIHTLRRCLCVLRGRRVLRARVEARELELGPRAGLRGRRCERGLWLRVRRFSPHHRRLNRGFQFGHMGLDRNMFVDLRDDLIQSTGHVEQRAGARAPLFSL